VQFVFPVSGDQVPCPGMGGAKPALTGDREVISAGDEGGQRIGAFQFLDDGPEEADPATMPRQQLHHPQYHEGFSAACPHPCDINALGHGRPLTSSS